MIDPDVLKTDACEIAIDIGKTALHNLEAVPVNGQVKPIRSKIVLLRNKDQQIMTLFVRRLGRRISDFKIFLKPANSGKKTENQL